MTKKKQKAASPRQADRSVSKPAKTGRTAKPRSRETSALAPRAKKIRYAVVGLGYISQIAVLPAFKHAENSELVALISLDPVKRERLAKKYGVEHTADYDGFEDCLRQADVDAVYIGLPNSMHHKFAVRAARLGVHVLCEKPMATSVDECREMIEVARNNDVKLMIAYRLHFEEANLEAIRIVKNRQIGEPRLFTSVFSAPVKDRGNIRLSEELGGGPMMDLGIYAINAARYLFGAEPTEVSAIAASAGGDERFREVDEMVSAVLKFPGDRLAVLTSSFGAADASYFEVMGTRGKLRVEPAYDFAKGLTHHLTIGEKTKTRHFAKRDQFAPELVYFSDCIRLDRPVEPSGHAGLADVQIILALQESANLGRAVSLEVPQPELQPGPSQEIRRPALARAPKLVHAAPPA